MFCIDWELGGRKNFRVGIFLNKDLLGQGYVQETNNFF